MDQIDFTVNIIASGEGSNSSPIVLTDQNNYCYGKNSAAINSNTAYFKFSVDVGSAGDTRDTNISGKSTAAISDVDIYNAGDKNKDDIIEENQVPVATRDEDKTFITTYPIGLNGGGTDYIIAVKCDDTSIDKETVSVIANYRYYVISEPKVDDKSYDYDCVAVGGVDTPKLGFEKWGDRSKLPMV